MLVELSTKEISEATDPESFGEHVEVARQGATVHATRRLELEEKTGKPVIIPLNAKKILSLQQGKEENEKSEE